MKKWIYITGFLTLALHFNANAASILKFRSLDINKMHGDELIAEKKGEAPRFAVVNEVQVAPTTEKSAWELQGDYYVWTQRIEANNAVSLNFAFEDFYLPEGATLEIFSTDLTQSIRPFTAQDNNKANELWTPVIMANDVTIVARVPANKMGELKLTLTKVNQGFRTFAQTTLKSGSCNVDVSCSEGEGWENEINAVAVISTGGSRFCSGFMVNNTAEDKTPFFMTANHCRVTSANAPSLVTYWNYQRSSCRGERSRNLNQFNTGAEFLAGNAASDFTLVKLNQAPDEEWNVSYAGWDRRDEDATQAVGIHHPGTDEKAISFSKGGTTITSYLQTTRGAGTHVRVAKWEVGTTEGGSSGSPLFNQDHRVIGQLHGGYASCNSKTADWYGRIHVSWEGGGTPTTSLKAHLDPIESDEMFVDTIQ